MLRTALALALGLGLATAAVADDPPKADEVAAKIKANPDDLEAINQYMTLQTQAFTQALAADADKAEAILEQIKATFEGLEPTADEARTMHSRVQGALRAYGERLDLARVKVEELAEKLRQNPADGEALMKYSQKVMQDIGSLVYADAEKAEAQIGEVRAFLTDIKTKAGAAAGQQADAVIRQLASLESRIATEKQRNELVGKPAAPLSVSAWVNGSPLTDEDLKGKVVLLDFWAVWCGPCIATFPHLREWNEKYADKGLVILGLTKYYGYDWDEQADKAVRGQGEVSPQAEQAMLEKFAAQYELKHRFAVSEDNSMSEYYGVTGIPQAVVIDREGKVRMIKVGSGDANAKALEAEIEKLLEAPVAGGE